MKSRLLRPGCLIELTIAGFILAVLAAVAIPDFLKFQARAKCSEPKTNLGAIFTSQTAYFGEHRTYAGGRNCFQLVRWKTEGQSLYSYYCGDSVIPCAKPGCTDCGGADALGLIPLSSISGFTIYAGGNVDRDSSDCDVGSMTDAKEGPADVEEWPGQ